MGERVRAFWERLKADIHRNPGLWIGVGISAVILLVAYLAYRKSSGALVPANGYGIPNYSSALGGDTTGGSTGYAPYQPVTSTAPVAPYVPTSSGVTAPGVAVPALGFTPPAAVGTGQPFSLPTARVIGHVIDRGVSASPTPTPYPTYLPPIQNPLAPAQLAHRGVSSPAPVQTVQNPSAAQDIAHRGVTHTTPTHYIIPTTIRPIPVATRGRVA